MSAPQVLPRRARRQAVFGLLLCWGLGAQEAPTPPQSVKKDEQPAVKKQGSGASAPQKAPEKRAVSIQDNSDQPAREDVPALQATREQTLPIAPQHTSDPLQGLWYGIMGISCLSILALGYTAWRLKASGPPTSPSLDALSNQVSAAHQRASRARSRYDELARRASQPPPPSSRPDPAPPSPLVTKEPYESKPATVRVPAQQEPPIVPARPAARAAGSNLDWNPQVRPRDELVDAYHVARTSADRTARDQFDNRYPYVRISCVNHDEWQFHKNITLRFQREDFGWYLIVSRGGSYQAFPWFTQDLASERESFKGVFEYPEGSGDSRLRLVRPALLQSQGDGWILTAPGEVQADV